MSVTFTADKATFHYEEVPCDFPGCVEGNRCGYCQDGVERQRVSDAPELNLGNGNAVALLGMLALPTTEWGDVEASVVPMVRKTLADALNLRRVRAPLDSEATDVGGPGTGQCRVVSFGNTDDQTMRRLMDLDGVLAWAEENQSGVSWG